MPTIDERHRGRLARCDGQDPYQQGHGQDRSATPDEPEGEAGDRAEDQGEHTLIDAVPAER